MKQYTYRQDELPTKGNSKLLNLVGDNKKVLEVGCAMGFQTCAMKEEQGCSIVGIEIDEAQAQQAKPYCTELIIGDIEKLDLAEKLGRMRFDVITFADVLEHLRDPVAALTKVQPFLSDSGYIVASIPNIAHSSVIYDLAHGRFDYRKFGLLDDTHIYFFTRRAIFETFESAGFTITACDRIKVRAIDTEFKTSPINNEDETFLEYISIRNPEFETYQFVVKAIPMHSAPSAHQAELIAALDKVQSLEASLTASQKESRKLRSHIAWLEAQPSQKLKSAISRLFKGI